MRVCTPAHHSLISHAALPYLLPVKVRRTCADRNTPHDKREAWIEATKVHQTTARFSPRRLSYRAIPKFEVPSVCTRQRRLGFFTRQRSTGTHNQAQTKALGRKSSGIGTESESEVPNNSRRERSYVRTDFRTQQEWR